MFIEDGAQFYPEPVVDIPFVGTNVDAWSFNHAYDIISEKHPNIRDILQQYANNTFVSIDEVCAAGGGETGIARKATSFFRDHGARETKYRLAPNGRRIINGEVFDCETHLFDCCFDRVVIEFEWNNKDAFFERDLSNLRRLDEIGRIDAGVIITRSKKLEPFFKRMVKENLISKDKINTSHTDHKKLISMILKGVGRLPVLALAINENGLERIS